jgi:hypothetical protein
MNRLQELRRHVLQDRQISRSEVAVIRDYIDQDGELNLQDMKVLVELLSDADDVCPEFDELFFPAMRKIVLQDGRIGEDEQFYLLKMLYSDGHIRESEKSFLTELCRDAREVSPEFEALCETALGAHATNWDVGGRG